MDSIVYIVGLVLGAILLLSVCYVYVRHQTFKLGSAGLAAFGVILVGMSVWQNISFSIDKDSISVQLEKALAAAEEARDEAATAKAEASRIRTATVQLADTFEVFKTQTALRDIGLYKGALDGRLSTATKASLVQFQKLKGLPQTKKVDERTLKALKLSPIRVLPVNGGAIPVR